MEAHEIQALARHGYFFTQALRGRLEETHISWVILSGHWAFKIKKPITLPFLDFSTLQLRKEYCQREVLLNSRFSSIYVGVVPVRRLHNQWFLGGTVGELMDYAVQMKRMATAKRMDKRLEQGKVASKNMRALADELADFHEQAQKVYAPFSLAQACETFHDISRIRAIVAEQLGKSYAQRIDQSLPWSRELLHRQAWRMQQRVEQGYKRDLHGDLHSGNIFLYEKPVIFDCIEFNDAYRQIDLLYEIAFLCMDLEAFQQPQLASTFLAAYTSRVHCFEEKADESLFNYFKCLRANVRAKVHAMHATQLQQQQEKCLHLQETKKYLNLMQAYMNSSFQLSAIGSTRPGDTG